jgi:predicted adenine nucleotide alpha hydrolase (AANH) superfamily ATPase
MSKPGLLIHVCCAPDAAYVVPLLAPEYEVTGFFYNPNIDPDSEYLLRLEETRRVAPAAGFALEVGPYEPEKGRRCAVCYALRLDRTARRAAGMGIPHFATVMSISPWKDAGMMNRIGSRLGRKYGLGFLEADFKKKDGFRKSVETSRRLGLYRQNYCGCRFSRRTGPPDGKFKP